MMMDIFSSGDSPTWVCGDLVSSPTPAEDIFNSSPNMAAAFPLPPLELEPFPNIFPTTNSFKEGQFLREKSDLSDVFFTPFKSSPAQVSLTLNSGQMSPMPYHNAYSQSQQQALLSPNGYSPNYCLDQFPPCNPLPGSTTVPGPNFGAAFPSMSVNVSMNMTMGYLPPDPSSLQHQMNWPAPGVTPASANSHGQSPYNVAYTSSPSQQFCHQPYSATYSFAADIRPEPTLETLRSQWIPNSSSSIITSAAVAALSSSSRSFGSTASSKRQKSSRSSENLSPVLSNFGGISKTNLCRICGKTYARPSTLKTHLRTHSGEKPYRCMECQKSFSQAANLTAHVRTHSGEKPFRCPICDRRFSQSSSVTTHMRTHSGERPYRCRLCKKAFSDSSTLTKHLRIHSGEKPYQCKLCLLRFSQSGNLNRHMRVHSNPGP